MERQYIACFNFLFEKVDIEDLKVSKKKVSSGFTKKPELNFLEMIEIFRTKHKILQKRYDRSVRT